MARASSTVSFVLAAQTDPFSRDLAIFGMIRFCSSCLPGLLCKLAYRYDTEVVSVCIGKAGQGVIKHPPLSNGLICIRMWNPTQNEILSFLFFLYLFDFLSVIIPLLVIRSVVAYLLSRFLSPSSLIFYLLPTTYYLLPTIYYLLSTTYYLLPTIYYCCDYATVCIDGESGRGVQLQLWDGSFNSFSIETSWLI